ncbi:MAG: UDP-3-O-(3-hydroxymyristoyl)glucosamine N-acyltransferase [Rhodopila sp.]|jgi:UDP-3-O-[3-hydroxymyristoyl] glucosamine N-acyltransferase
MGDGQDTGNARFFARTGPHTLATITAVVGCEAPVEEILISGLASLEDAGPDQISFLGTPRHATLLEQTQAGAVIVPPSRRDRTPERTVALVSSAPIVAWARVAALFHPAATVQAGVHPTACVAPGAMVDDSVEVSAHAVIGTQAKIGPHCLIGPGAMIGDGVVMGPDCRIGSHASITHSILGARVYIYPGARIGQEGFGFDMTEAGFVTIPQLGCVILEDDVEVGANSTIDRGALRDTVIGSGTRLDNLVQIAHNVRIGRYCAIAAQCGIAGSVAIGDFVVMGGQAAIAPHVTIRSRVRIGAQAGVMSDIEEGAVVVGSPARPRNEFFREIAALKQQARR